MDTIFEINNIINETVWGLPMVILLAFTGIFLSIGLKFMPWREFANALKITFGRGSNESSEKGIAPRKALFTALSATVGTGNIAGVATAIYIGGPGSLFYMWLISLFGMATKYTEVFLAVKYRQKNEDGEWYGGPMYYISKGVGEKSPALGKALAMLFAISGMLAAFGTGSGVQVNSIANALQSTFGIPSDTTGIVVAILAGSAIIGGIKRISDVASKLVPTMVILYLSSCIIVLIIFAENIPSAFAMIFKGAFGLDPVVGGAVGTAILMGFKRGIFSNEAGLGSAPIAHAAAETDNPSRQGIIAMIGVFIDTIVVCTFTGLIILVSGIYQPDNGINGATLTTKSFAAAFSGGDIVVSISLTLFAFTTILGWSYYGEKCFEYLIKNNFAKHIYRLLFIISIYFSATLSLEQVWAMADTFNGLMILPNLIGLLILSPMVFKLTKELKSKI